MKRSLILLTVASYLALTFTALLDFNSPEKAQAVAKPSDLIVHEWGTFTSVSGKTGVALDWRPLSAEASDLPKFVYTENESEGYRGTYESRTSGKGRELVKVRMETPVIYFYSKKEMDVDVEVSFPRGRITEWYPQASVVNKNAGNNQEGRFTTNVINWGTIKLLPDEKPNYLREAAFSHYYPARETDAVPVQVCNADKTRIEKEKFLFYRGVGNFDLPLSVKIDFRLIEKLAGENLTVERPETTKNLDGVFDELERILTAEGLYAKEAKAMIETWKDSWFEEGLRVFYILPTASTNQILPLKVHPQPKETVRVLVGRAEVITPEMERDVRKQVSLLQSSSDRVREEAQQNLKKHGRFYEPILKSLLDTERNAKVREQIQKLIDLG